jgi:alkylhydroperoxidase family enzyme
VSWLCDERGRDLEWEGVVGYFPEAADAVAQLHRTIWQQGDPVLLELVRLRIATLLRFGPGLAVRSEQARKAGLSDDKIAALSQWPTSPLYDARERACLALTEQILMSANDVTDGLVADVLTHLSPEECYTLVEGISAMETLQRGCLVLGLTPSPEASWLTPGTAKGSRERVRP